VSVDTPIVLWSFIVTRRLLTWLTSAVLLIAGAALVLWPAAFVYFWDVARAAAVSPWKRFVVAAALALLGYLLYLARRDYRRVYGAGETALGMALCWAGLGAVATISPSASATTVLGGVYIIVRGLDNYYHTGVQLRNNAAA